MMEAVRTSETSVDNHSTRQFNPEDRFEQEPIRSQTAEANDNAEYLQPYPVAVGDAVLEIGPAIISVVLSLDKHLSETNTSCVQKFFLQSVCCCLMRCILLKVRTAKCFTYSNKRVRFEVILQNEYTFYS
jgi:hypothetical protein